MYPIYTSRIGSYSDIAQAFPPESTESAHIAKDTTVFLHSRYTSNTGWYGTSASLYYKGKHIATHYAHRQFIATILGPTHPLHGERYLTVIDAYATRTPGGVERLRKILSDAHLLSSMDAYLRKGRVVVRDKHGFELEAHRIFIQAGRGVIVEAFDAKVIQFVAQESY